MQHITSQSVRIFRYISLSCILYQCSIYSSNAPYAQMQREPCADIRIAIGHVPDGMRLPQAEPLSRSVSHGSFQGAQKPKKSQLKKRERKALHHESAEQSHTNSADTINDYSINVAQAKPRTYNSKLFLGVSALVLAGMSAILYMQVRITNQAEQIGSNTQALDGIGDKLDASAASIATSAQAIATILELIVNETRKG